MLSPLSSPDFSSCLSDLLAEESVTIQFQPIFDLASEALIAYEALTRGPKGSLLESPDELFACAQALRQLPELERLCRRKAIASFARLELQGCLFLNVSPFALVESERGQEEMLQQLSAAGLTVDRVVIEVTEGQRIEDESLFQKTISYYRDLGFQIAIDDLGSGYSGLKQWSELRPDIVKIDRYFIDRGHRNPVKREFLKSIVALARATNTRVLAEGIEQPEELALLKNLGIDMVQGFFLGRPSIAPLLQAPANFDVDQSSEHGSIEGELNHLSAKGVMPRQDIVELLLARQVITLPCSYHEAFELFFADKTLDAVAVVNSYESPLGILYRDQFNEALLESRYDTSYCQKNIVKVMDDQALIVDGSESIEQVCQKFTDSDDDHGRYLVVTSRGRYQGIVSIKQLLKKVNNAKISYALHANPLTLLPSNVVIDDAIAVRLESNKEFSLAYLNVNGLKAFNDYSGYRKGDEVIKTLADIIQAECEHKDYALSHIRGDHFVLLIDTPYAEMICRSIIVRFDLFCSKLMPVQDLEHAENIPALRVEGERRVDKVSVLSLSVGLVTPELNGCSAQGVMTLAASAQQKAEEYSNSHLFVCQRKSNDGGTDAIAKAV